VIIVGEITIRKQRIGWCKYHETNCNVCKNNTTQDAADRAASIPLALVYQAMHVASRTEAALLQRPAVVDARQLHLLLVSGAGRASSALVARSRPGHRPWVAAAAAALAQVAERTGPCIDQLAKQFAANARSATLTPAAAAALLGGLAWRIGSYHRGAGRRADGGKPEFCVGSK
jgi:hypothetical protein